ncbi:nucleoside hydrolase [Arcanobacterium wilhelmae]|uniref:nucleoside hydrolase n=1 Tax=Arcanobacterium wilhelmae TaxID=1803177 RepID=UPI00241522AD|nr:nucleoside hydrolase [Arcanobacterium wilhelmae]WFN89898.1 nucleoside hydrolase [Arcanobacterium wilhelmae]
MSDARPALFVDVDTGVDDALALAYLLGQLSAGVGVPGAGAKRTGAGTGLGAGAGVADAGAPDFADLAVIASYGNVAQTTSERNTWAVLDLLGCTDVPVFAGASSPSWANAFIPDAGCAIFHGVNGLGGVDAVRFGGASTNGIVPAADLEAGVALLAARDPCLSVGGYVPGDPHANPAWGSAREFVGTGQAAQLFATRLGEATASDGQTGEMSAAAHPGVPTPSSSRVGGVNGETVPLSAGASEVIRALERGPVQLITLGPLTTAAQVVRHRPDLLERLSVVSMAGALDEPGNCWDGVSETNVIQDPQAADTVFASAANVTVVGLDVTHRCLLPASAVESWRGTPAGDFFAEIARFSIRANAASDPIFARGMPLHDPLAVACALDTTYVRCEELPLRVQLETRGAAVRGRTVAAGAGFPTSGRYVHVALEVDSRRFVEDLCSAVATAVGAA